MNESKPPLPTLLQLYVSTIWAIVLAVVILLTAVLPAEYAIDPTGLGRVLGFTQLAMAKKELKSKLLTQKPVVIAPKMQEVDPATVTATLNTLSPEKMSVWQDTVTLIIPPLKGLEYKFYFHRGQQFDFLWSTTKGETLEFDFHGDPKGNPPDDFVSFKLATENKFSGSLVAPFAGKIGWYWENKTRLPVTLILNTRGDYRIIGKI